MARKSLYTVRKARRIPKGRRMDVTRAEFDRVIELLNQRGEMLNDLRADQRVQLMRIAQIQAELDRLFELTVALRRRLGDG
jgi:hypothetical protein